MTTTEEQSKPRYEKAMKLLSEYKQKAYNVTVKHGGVREFCGIEVFASALTIDEKVEHIRTLLAGMGFSIHGNHNTETIYIQ